jgi:DNA adenine methylase
MANSVKNCRERTNKDLAHQTDRMAPYTCETCQKVFKQKSHFDSHKARKRPCKKDVRIEQLVEQKVQEALAKHNIIVPLPVAVEAVAVAAEVNTGPVRPFLKWVGGKSQILEEVLATFPKQITNYYEPFLGGGSVLLGLLSATKRGDIKVSGKIYASDINSNLIGLYKNIQSSPDALITEVKQLIEEFSPLNGTEVNRKPKTLEEAKTSQESYYFWIRSRFNAMTREERQTPLGSAMLLFMNKTCFRGVYREGPNGFNVPFGNYKNPTILEEAHIREVSALVKNVVFRCCGFADALAGVSAGDFVYLDPPYAPENETSFVGYTADGFSLDQHKALFALCETMRGKGVRMCMSNAAVKLVCDAFVAPSWNTKVIVCRRAINSKNPEAKTNEVLVTNESMHQAL